MFYKLRLDSQPIRLIKSHTITNRAKLLLLNALFYLDKNNMLIGSPKDLMKLLNLGKYDFEEGMKELKRFDLVRKYTKREYMFNPEILHYGDDKHLYILHHKWETQTTRGIRKS